MRDKAEWRAHTWVVSASTVLAGSRGNDSGVGCCRSARSLSKVLDNF
jgi:hypothetical protein